MPGRHGDVALVQREQRDDRGNGSARPGWRGDIADLRRILGDADVQQPAATDADDGGERRSDRDGHAVHVFGDGEQRADHALDGRDGGGWGDGGLHVRHVEPADEGGDDQRGVGRGVHLRRLWEPDVKDGDQGDGAHDVGGVRSGDESSDGDDLRCERESGIQRDVSV